MSLSASQLAQHVAKALSKASGPEVFAYSWKSPWQSGPSIQVGDRAVSVSYCASPLELREALIGERTEPKVLLVGFEEAELGQDVLARLFRHKLLHVDRWQMAAEAFGARDIDPRLYPLTWIPDALLDAAARRRVQPMAVLTYDDAIGVCVSRVLGLEAAADLQDLLQVFEAGAGAWVEQPAERRDVYRKYLVERIGTVVNAVLGAVTAGNSLAAVAIGLACEVLYASDKDGELRDARVRLEAKLGGERLSTLDGRKWADAAIRLTKARDDARRHHVCRLAIDLVRAVGAEAYLGSSSVLPEALDRRLEDLGDAVRAFLRNPAALSDVERAAATVNEHALIPRDHPGPSTASMIARLCRREGALAGAGTSPGEIKEYLHHGAWEDLARRGLRAVRPESLSKSASKLLDRVAERRAASDRRFAEHLAQRAADGAAPPGVLPVESALAELVAPLAAAGTVALIVLDGMSWDVYLAIASELDRSGWTAWTRDKAPSSLLATVPSVTECSRASLLAGRLMRGTGAQEKPAFSAHPALVQASRNGRPPTLLHKAEIQADNQLSREAAALLGDSDQRVIGIVINAIDDALAKSEQVRIDWSVETIPLLAAVLDQARLAGRTVIITSDHGHVLERNAEHRNVGDGERWRAGTGEVAPEEVRITGPRVNTLMGSDVIVPWTEGLRYSPRKNGYHGGATLQEMLVPFGVWTAGAAPPEGYRQLTLVPPTWWSLEGGAAEAPRPLGAPKTGDLFAPQKESTWIKDLLGSPTFARQKDRVGRLALDAQKLQALLGCLDERGGRAGVETLAAAVQMPPMRMRGVLSVLQRMLNVDGFPVVSMEPGSNTVILDMRLVRTQFGL